jgi:hypothetical protein
MMKLLFHGKARFALEPDGLIEDVVDLGLRAAAKDRGGDILMGFASLCPSYGSALIR